MALRAPAAIIALTQATEAWPKRSTATDGIVGDESHQGTSSDHNPGKAGYAHAWDLTHDPKNGCDCDEIAENLRLSRDERIKYVIRRNRIFSSYAYGGIPAWTWRPYRGTYHGGHVHVSILDTKAACEDISEWALEGEMARTFWLEDADAPNEKAALAFVAWADRHGMEAKRNSNRVRCQGDEEQTRTLVEKYFADNGFVMTWDRVPVVQEAYRYIGAKEPVSECGGCNSDKLKAGFADYVDSICGEV